MPDRHGPPSRARRSGTNLSLSDQTFRGLPIGQGAWIRRHALAQSLQAHRERLGGCRPAGPARPKAHRLAGPPCCGPAGSPLRLHPRRSHLDRTRPPGGEQGCPRESSTDFEPARPPPKEARPGPEPQNGPPSPNLTTRPRGARRCCGSLLQDRAPGPLNGPLHHDRPAHGRCRVGLHSSTCS